MRKCNFENQWDGPPCDLGTGGRIRRSEAGRALKTVTFRFSPCHKNMLN
jgi:hypothetical protein